MSETDPFAGQWRDLNSVLSAPIAEKAAAPEEPSGVPPLTGGERALLYLTAALATAVSVLGLLSSFTSLEYKGREWGWEWPWLLPTSMDLSIPAFTLTALLLIRTNMPLAWVALVPRALTGASVYLNWNAATNLPGRIGHAVLTLLWVVFSEIAGHVYASQVGLVTGTRMEKIRRIRWALAPISTMAIWRRMNLWEETSYRAALGRQRDRLLARAGLRETYGRAWRFTAPRRDRVLLRLGDLNPAETFLSETSETSPSETGTTAVETAETETTPRSKTRRDQDRFRDLTVRETETGGSVYETETPSLTAAETAETTTSCPADKTETKTRAVSVSRPAETETTKVSPIGDRNPETETQLLLGLMRDRGSETAVTLKDAITETGRPKATAAKRLKAARDLYRETAA